MEIILVTYLLYIAISLSLTIWVGRTLHTRGRVFVIESFHGNAESADSVNHLLLVGFYLINFGFVCLFMRMGTPPETVVGAVEYITTKIGIVLVILGFMHFYNMRNISNMRNKALARANKIQPAAPSVD